MKKPIDVDEYIRCHPKSIQIHLRQIRAAIRKAAPGAEETISYSMPAFKQNGMLVWFAAHTTHIGFYPRASGIATFKKELASYKSAKGSVQFPFDKPMPLALIQKIVKFRLSENRDKAAAGKKKN